MNGNDNSIGGFEQDYLFENFLETLPPEEQIEAERERWLDAFLYGEE